MLLRLYCKCISEEIWFNKIQHEYCILVTSHFGYVELQITRIIFSIPLDFEITRLTFTINIFFIIWRLCFSSGVANSVKPDLGLLYMGKTVVFLRNLLDHKHLFVLFQYWVHETPTYQRLEVWRLPVQARPLLYLCRNHNRKIRLRNCFRYPGNHHSWTHSNGQIWHHSTIVEYFLGNYQLPFVGDNHLKHKLLITELSLTADLQAWTPFFLVLGLLFFEVGYIP